MTIQEGIIPFNRKRSNEVLLNKVLIQANRGVSKKVVKSSDLCEVSFSYPLSRRRLAQEPGHQEVLRWPWHLQLQPISSVLHWPLTDWPQVCLLYW